MGDSSGTPRQLVNRDEQIDDYLRVLQYLKDPNEHDHLFPRGMIDVDQICLWGWSNSGGHVAKIGTSKIIYDVQTARLKLISSKEDMNSLKRRSCLPNGISLKISGVISLNPLSDAYKNLKFHFYQDPFSIGQVGHLILGDFLVSKIPWINKRFSLNVKVFGKGGLLGTEEASRGFKMLEKHMIEEEEEEEEEGNSRVSRRRRRRRSSMTGQERFINLVAGRYGLDLINNRSDGKEIQTDIFIGWSSSDGLISDRLPKEFIQACQETGDQHGIFVQSFQHQGDHFELLDRHSPSFEESIQRQLDFIRKTFEKKTN